MEFPDDNHCIRKVLEGKGSCFSYLVDKHKDLAYTLALRIVKDPEDAEEIAQDAFVKAYQALPKFKFRSKFSTWLFRIVYNTAISKVRQTREQKVYLEDLVIEDPQWDTDYEDLGNLEAEESKQLLNRVLDTLPEVERIIITLYYLKEYPVEDIAEVTGLSKSNVKVKLFRTRKKIGAGLKTLMNDVLHSQV